MEKIESDACMKNLIFFLISSSGFESWSQNLILLIEKKMAKSKENSSLFRENKKLREALAVCTPPAPEPSAKRPGS